MTGGGQGDGGGGASDYRLAYQTAYHPISEGIVQITTAVFTVRKDGIWRRGGGGMDGGGGGRAGRGRAAASKLDVVASSMPIDMTSSQIS